MKKAPPKQLISKVRKQKTKAQAVAGFSSSSQRWAASPPSIKGESSDQPRKLFNATKSESHETIRPSTAGGSTKSTDKLSPSRPSTGNPFKSRVQDVIKKQGEPMGKENAERFRFPKTKPQEKKKTLKKTVSVFKSNNEITADDVSFDNVPLNGRNGQERLLLGGDEDDDDEMYTFGSAQITAQSQSPNISRRNLRSGKQSSPRLLHPSSLKQHSAIDSQILSRHTVSNNDLIETERPKDADLFEAMRSPQQKDNSHQRKVKKEIKVNQKSSAIIERANEAARKAQARLGMESLLEEKCARILDHAAACLSQHLTQDGSSESTAFLLSDCDGSIPLTQGLVGQLVQKPKMTQELLERPPFRFLHDLVSEVTRLTGLAEGLFDESSEMDPRNMGKAPRTRYLEKLIVLVDAQLQLGGTLVSEVKASKIVAGLEPAKTNKLLQLLAVAANINPSSAEAVISILGFTPQGLTITVLKDSSLQDGRRRADEARRSAMLHNEQIEEKQKQRQKEEMVRKAAQEKARREFKEKEKAAELEVARLERVAAEAAAEEVQRLKKVSEDSRQEKSRLRLELANAVAVDGQLSGRRDEDKDDELEDKLREKRHNEAVAAAVAQERVRIAAEEEIARDLARKKQLEKDALEKERKEAIDAAVAEERRRITELKEAEKRAREQARQKELDEQRLLQEQEDQERKHKEAIAKAVIEERQRIAAEEQARHEAEAKAQQLALQREEEELTKQRELEEREKLHREQLAAAVAEERANAAAEERARREAKLKERELAMLKVQEAKARKKELEEQERLHKEALAKAVAEERERIALQVEKARLEAEEEAERVEKERIEELHKTQQAEKDQTVRESSDKTKQELWDEAKSLAEIAVQEEYEAKQHNELVKRSLSHDLAASELEEAKLESLRAREDMVKATEARRRAEQVALEAKLELEQLRQETEAHKFDESSSSIHQDQILKVKADAMENELKVREELKVVAEAKHKEEMAREVANAKAQAAEHAREMAELKAEVALKELEAMRSALSSALVVSPENQSQEDEEEEDGGAKGGNDEMEIHGVFDSHSMISSQLTATDLLQLEANKSVMEEISIERAALAEERKQLQEARQKDALRLEEELKKLEEEKQKFEKERTSPEKHHPHVPRLNFPSPIADRTSMLDETVVAQWKDTGDIEVLTTDADTDVEEKEPLSRHQYAITQYQPLADGQDPMVTPTKQGTTKALLSPMTPSGLPPDLLGYVKQLFESHDTDGSGCLDTQEFWWAISSLGLGLSDNDILALQASGDVDKDGALDWHEFVPVATSLIQDRFKRRDWRKRHENPWIKLYCHVHQAPYYHNRLTSESEWVTGDSEQARKVGVLSIHASPLATPTTSAAARAARLKARAETNPQFTENWNGVPSHSMLGSEMNAEEEGGAIDAEGNYYEVGGGGGSVGNQSVAQSYYSQAPSQAASLAASQAYSQYHGDHQNRAQSYGNLRTHETLQNNRRASAPASSMNQGFDYSQIDYDVGGRVVIHDTPKESLNGLHGEVASIDFAKNRVHVRTDPCANNNYQGKVFAFKMEHVMSYHEDEQFCYSNDTYQQNEGTSTELHADFLLSPKTEMNWELHVDPSTDTPYYVNRETGDSTWTKPSTTAPPLSPSHDPPPTYETIQQGYGFGVGGESNLPASHDYQHVDWSESGDPQQAQSYPQATGSYEGGGTFHDSQIEGGNAQDHGYVIVADENEGEPMEYFLCTKTGESMWEIPQLHEDPSIHDAHVQSMVRWSKIYDVNSAAHYWQHDESGHMQWHAPGTHANSASNSLHSPMPSPKKQKAGGSGDASSRSWSAGGNSAGRSVGSRSGNYSGPLDTASLQEQMKLQKALNEQMFESSVTEQDYRQEEKYSDPSSSEQEGWSKMLDHDSGAHYWLHHETGHTEWDVQGNGEYQEEDYYDTGYGRLDELNKVSTEEERKEMIEFNQHNKEVVGPSSSADANRNFNLDTSPVRVGQDSSSISIAPRSHRESQDKIIIDEIIETQNKEVEVKRRASSQGLSNLHSDLSYDAKSPRSNQMNKNNKNDKSENLNDSLVAAKNEKDLKMKRMASTRGISNLHSELDYDSPSSKAMSSGSVLLSPSTSARVPVPTPTSKAGSRQTPKGGTGGALSGRASPMTSGQVPIPRPTPTSSARGSARSARSINDGGGVSPVIATKVPRPSPKVSGQGKNDFQRYVSMSPDGAGSSMMLPRVTLQKNKSFSSLDYGGATG